MKWEKSILGKYVLELSSGGRPKGGAIEEGIPSLGAEHLDGLGGFHFKTMKYIPVSYYEKLKSGKISNDDILIVKDGATTGKVSFVGSGFPFQDAAINEHVFNLRVNRDKLYPKYCFYFLTSNSGQDGIMSDFRGATVGGISKKFVDKIEIPVPPLPVQERIAAILDEADALRKKDAALLKKYDELLQSIFYDMFGDFDSDNRGWSNKNVGSLLSLIKDGTKCGPFGSALKKDEYTETGIPVWIMDNIQGLDFVPNGSLHITEDKFRELESYSVENNDIIISRAGTVGKMTVVNGISYPSIISTNLIRLSLNTELISPYYFVHLMKYSGDKFGRLKKGKDGAFTHMNTGILKSLDIPLPPMKLQAHFNKVLEGINNLKQTILTQQAQSEALFQSLLQRTFKGELV